MVKIPLNPIHIIVHVCAKTHRNRDTDTACRDYVFKHVDCIQVDCLGAWTVFRKKAAECLFSIIGNFGDQNTSPSHRYSGAKVHSQHLQGRPTQLAAHTALSGAYKHKVVNALTLLPSIKNT